MNINVKKWICTFLRDLLEDVKFKDICDKCERCRVMQRPLQSAAINIPGCMVHLDAPRCRGAGVQPIRACSLRTRHA